jgi:hypothetical protein
MEHVEERRVKLLNENDDPTFTKSITDIVEANRPTERKLKLLASHVVSRIDKVLPNRIRWITEHVDPTLAYVRREMALPTAEAEITDKSSPKRA